MTERGPRRRSWCAALPLAVASAMTCRCSQVPAGPSVPVTGEQIVDGLFFGRPPAGAGECPGAGTRWQTWPPETRVALVVGASVPAAAQPGLERAVDQLNGAMTGLVVLTTVGSD